MVCGLRGCSPAFLRLSSLHTEVTVAYLMHGGTWLSSRYEPAIAVNALNAGIAVDAVNLGFPLARQIVSPTSFSFFICREDSSLSFGPVSVGSTSIHLLKQCAFRSSLCPFVELLFFDAEHFT